MTGVRRRRIDPASPRPYLQAIPSSGAVLSIWCPRRLGLSPPALPIRRHIRTCQPKRVGNTRHPRRRAIRHERTRLPPGRPDHPPFICRATRDCIFPGLAATSLVFIVTPTETGTKSSPKTSASSLPCRKNTVSAAVSTQSEKFAQPSHQRVSV